jgi:hypothetical protein
MASFEPTQVGPQVFAFLGAPMSERISGAEQDELAGRLAQAIVHRASDA